MTEQKQSRVLHKTLTGLMICNAKVFGGEETVAIMHRIEIRDDRQDVILIDGCASSSELMKVVTWKMNKIRTEKRDVRICTGSQTPCSQRHGLVTLPAMLGQ